MPTASNFTTTSQATWNPTEAFLRRLCALYRVTSEKHGIPGGMWGTIHERKADIHNALVKYDLIKLWELLVNPAGTDLYFGMDTLAKHNTPHLSTGSGFSNLLVDIITENLTFLSEVSGAKRFQNFENNRKRETLEIENILVELDKICKIRLQFPNPFPQEFGLVTSRGIMGHRVPTSIYHALKARELSSLTGDKIVEIGAGVGRTAFYSYEMGFKNYTIVDLPMSLVGQACFLAATLGDEVIWLDGEDSAASQNKIRLYCPHTFFSLEEKYDVALNIDSITEMPLEQGCEYFAYLAHHSSIVYSMNHESNPDRTLDIAKLAKIPILPIRFASVIRRGYVEELYFFKQIANPVTK